MHFHTPTHTERELDEKIVEFFSNMSYCDGAAFSWWKKIILWGQKGKSRKVFTRRKKNNFKKDFHKFYQLKKEKLSIKIECKLVEIWLKLKEMKIIQVFDEFSVKSFASENFFLWSVVLVKFQSDNNFNFYS